MRIEGSIPALVTPFQRGGALDVAAFEDLIDWHIEQGSNGLVIGGSTGESGALEEFELAALLEIGVRRAAGRIPVIAGTGAAATSKALRLARLAKSIGATAALAVTPFYSRPTQNGMLAHFTALADDGGLPVILYNVPGRTGVDLLVETVAQLALHPQIVAIKEAVVEPQRMLDLLKLRSATFAVLSGDDPTALFALGAGADGLISVAANVKPKQVAELCRAATQGQMQAAQEIDAMLRPLYAALASEPNPIPVKAGLAMLGRVQDILRLPLLPLSPEYRPELAAALLGD